MYRIVSDLHSEFWPESQAKALTLTDMRVQPMDGDDATILLLPGATVSYRRSNAHRWVIERLAERFLAVYDIPGNHYGYGGTRFDVCEAPTLLGNYYFGATLADDTLTAANLWADFQRGNPVVEEVCRVGMNDFRQIKGITPAKVKARHREHLAFLDARILPGGNVMPHFVPSLRTISPEYSISELRGYYASGLEGLILRKPPSLWIHAHIHSKSEYRIGDTRVTCNPAGYDGLDHDPDCVSKFHDESRLCRGAAPLHPPPTGRTEGTGNWRTRTPCPGSDLRPRRCSLHGARERDRHTAAPGRRSCRMNAAACLRPGLAGSSAAATSWYAGSASSSR